MTLRGRLSKFVAGGIAIAALTAAVGGTAFAQTPSGTPAAPPIQRGEEFLKAIAGKLGKTTDEVKAAVKAVQKDRLAEEVKAGKLTQARADEIAKRIDATAGLGFGPMGPGRGHGPGKPGVGPGPANPAAMAQFLGVQPIDLRGLMTGGKTLAQVAQEKGKTRDELKAFLTTQAQTALTAAVKSGRITQTQADARLADLKSNLDAMIDRTGPKGPPKGPKARGREGSQERGERHGGPPAGFRQGGPGGFGQRGAPPVAPPRPAA
ncbi:MAG: hypothetical protein EPO26_16335 [Chloroflexota bacterium]|nr:MAG: hypothetical protein EPO26_16335 [Chloroflexota bacterium]